MSPPSDTEKWESNPVGMLRVHQAHPYHLGQCIADLVDNSYDAHATKIDVRIALTKERRMYVLILDNGDGIPKDEWKKIMTLGLERKRGNTDLGVYGVGLKLSSLSQAHEVKASQRCIHITPLMVPSCADPSLFSNQCSGGMSRNQQ